MKFVALEQRDQHARRVRYPDESTPVLAKTRR